MIGFWINMVIAAWFMFQPNKESSVHFHVVLALLSLIVSQVIQIKEKLDKLDK